ncbi:MAG: M15 family metallopeptidase [Cyclobacteriaceae bacterium]
MRYCLKTAFFAFFSLIFFQTLSQGRLHVASLSVQSWFENEVDGKEVIQKSIWLDSLKAAQLAVATLMMEDSTNGWKNWSTVGNHTFGKNRGDMAMITDVNALHPYFRDKVQQLILICRSKGIDLAFVETYRTHAKQAEYKGMGKKYTRSGAGKSKHQYGFAVDVVPMIGDSAVWHNPVLWRKVGMVGEKLGLRWGGRWRKPFDPGHFEWTGGLNTADLSSGKKPFIPKQHELYPCLTHDLAQLKKYWAAWEAEQALHTRK